jgi:TolB-like protein/DNA-binding winged helix-turn-helix (wHTH) protein/Tfp pilus assembly protein PilF
MSASHPALFTQVLTAQEFHFDEFTLDRSRYRLQRGERPLRLEKLPMELLILLVQRRGELVSREEIAEQLWGKDVFVDVDHSINTAVRKVRMALRDDPDHPRFVETIVGKGYRFAAPVTCTNGDARAGSGSAESEIGPKSTVEARAISGPAPVTIERAVVPMWLIYIAVGIAVLAVLIFAVVRRREAGQKTSPATAIKALAVLPLRNLSGDPNQEYLADGLTEAITGRLSGIQHLRVISRTSAMHFKDSKLSAPEIARTLHVDALVEGSVIRDGSRIRVTAQLIRGPSDDHFWSETYDRDFADALSLESDIAQSIAAKVRITISGPERERLAAARAVSPQVYEDYLKGWFALDNPEHPKSEVQKALQYFQAAINKDPTFAPAYLGLAIAYDELGSTFMGDAPQETLPKEIAAVQKALALEPDFAEAHAMLASMQQKQWHWGEAQSEYTLALKLKPSDAHICAGFAQWLVYQGRADEALAEVRHARELDPFAITGTDTGWILFNARRYQEAIQEYRSALSVRPDDVNALWNLGFALLANHQPEEAITTLQKAVPISNRSSGILATLVAAYAQSGQRTDALRILDEIRKRKQAGYVPAGAFVYAYVGLGDYDQAFAWLDHAYQEHSNVMQFLKVNPFFDPLRGDARFSDVLQRVGLN